MKKSQVAFPRTDSCDKVDAPSHRFIHSIGNNAVSADCCQGTAFSAAMAFTVHTPAAHPTSAVGSHPQRLLAGQSQKPVRY